MHNLYAQVENTGMTDRDDTASLGKLTLSGYVDVYYGFDFAQPSSGERAYSVSSARHNEMNVNLAYMDIRYQSERVRARFVPGIGTYINANYANEQGTLKNLVEAYAGIRLSKSKNIWLDAGVLGSPYTNESAISKDHLMYTRSFSAEYSPYYVTGTRLSLPLSQKLTMYLYLLNGWQQIGDVNNEPALGTQIEYKVNNRLLFNWNTYVGSEQSKAEPLNRMRYFTDLYAIYNPKGKFGFTTSAYIGVQQRRDTLTGKEVSRMWGQANFIGRYRLSKQLSLSGRLEYMEDMHQAVIVPVTTLYGFNTYSGGLCLTFHITPNALFRFEGRHFYSPRKVYINEKGNADHGSSLVIGNMTVWF